MEITPKTLVERFYYEVWNRSDEEVAREILHPDFRFRASLGPERRGPQGFIDYMRSIHTALTGYTCIIDDLIVTPYRAAAGMTFEGVHRGATFFLLILLAARYAGRVVHSSPLMDIKL